MPEPILERVDIIVRATMHTGEVYEETIVQRPMLLASGPDTVSLYLHSFMEVSTRALRATKLPSLIRKVITT